MSDFNSKEFGNKLRELRKSKGLSQDNLANKLNDTKCSNNKRIMRNIRCVFY